MVKHELNLADNIGDNIIDIIGLVFISGPLEGIQSLLCKLMFCLLFYRGATETQLVWNPPTGPTYNVEAPFSKFYTPYTNSHMLCIYTIHSDTSRLH